VTRENVNELFKDKRAKENKENEKLIEELYKQIGQVTYERDWLKKKLDLNYQDRISFVDI